MRLPKAESCITAAELGTRVEAHLHRPVFVSPSAADISIEGRIEKSPSGTFHAVVGGTRRDGTSLGTRDLVSEGSDCRALDDSLVLVVALMIDPDADGSAPPAAPPKVVIEREIVHERVVVHEREIHDVKSEPARPWLVEAYALGGAAFGRVPGVAPTLGLAARIGPPSFLPVELRVATLPSASLDAGAGASVAFWELEGGLGVCPSIPIAGRVLELGGCAEARLGNVRATGSGFSQSFAADRLVFDAGLEGRFVVRPARALFLFAGVTGLVPLVRQRYTVTLANGTMAALYERPAISAETTLGVGVHFAP